jgi:putative ABC transport system substrate-binding protein
MKATMLLIILVLCILVALLAAEAQQPKNVHRIGALSALGTTPGRNPFVEAFLEGMRALGYVEGQHFVLESRGADGQFEGFPELAAELVRLKVEVIVAQGTPAALAAKHATTMIPVVMVGVGDPVGSGLVASLARPGGNITGLSNLSTEVVGKQLEFLKEVLPVVSHVAVLWNPANPAHALMVRAADVAAQALGVQLHLVEARGRGPDAFDRARSWSWRTTSSLSIAAGSPSSRPRAACRPCTRTGAWWRPAASSAMRRAYRTCGGTGRRMWTRS